MRKGRGGDEGWVRCGQRVLKFEVDSKSVVMRGSGSRYTVVDRRLQGTSAVRPLSANWVTSQCAAANPQSPEVTFHRVTLSLVTLDLTWAFRLVLWAAPCVDTEENPQEVSDRPLHDRIRAY